VAQVRKQQHSIIIIREEEEQMTGGSCCGTFSGDFREFSGDAVFAERRQMILSTASIYRRLIDEYEDYAEIDIVDARNLPYLIPRLIRDTRKYKVPFRESLRTVFGYRLPTIICDGRIIATGNQMDWHFIYKRLRDQITV